METLLQPKLAKQRLFTKKRHNPYFSGNSFATEIKNIEYVPDMGHNPYFSGNSFATVPKISFNLAKNCKKVCDFQP